ncbi:MAG: glycoside hydrolase family 57 protein [Nanoarchaeota archaeon]
MVSVCFYFQVHQPYRLKKYSIFEIGQHSDYFDQQKNRQVIEKIAKKCYLPTNKILLDLIRQHNGRFKITFSLSGVVLEQFQRYAPEVLQSFIELSKTGCVEFLAETYHHSLSYLFSKEEFKEQVLLHQKKIKDIFDFDTKVFRNTELIYNNELAHTIEEMGFKAILAEGADHILGWRSPNFVYRPKTTTQLKLLLKNYKLSDDIAFRFGNKGWEEHPLTAPKFAKWISAVNGNGVTVNLFMDYETFGEHQWEDTGIFNFLKHLPEEIFRHPHNDFKTVSEITDAYEPVSELDIHSFISWADVERDLSAWLGNRIQNSAIHELYKFEKQVKALNDPRLLADWRKLTTSDHFYYMCTKWFNDGDVHKYFNPYNSPYDCFIAFMNVLNDIAIRINTHKNNKKRGEIMHNQAIPPLPIEQPSTLILT